MPKFRCFDKDTKTMHEVVSIDFRDWRVYYEAYGFRNYWNKNVVLMQSTGLHDKNGVEIFEGDVVNINHTFRNPMTGSGTLTLNKKFEVVFINGMFTREGSSMGLSKDLKYLTVVGDVYKNPELLEDV